MKSDIFKKNFNLNTTKEIFIYCLKNQISLNEVSFNFTKDFENNEEDLLSVIKESGDKDFNYQALFVLANKMNYPKNVVDIKDVSNVRIAFFNEKINDNFLYKDNNFIVSLQRAFKTSNGVIKAQYFPLITGNDNIDNMKNNAKEIRSIINKINENDKDISLDLEKYIDKICSSSFINTEKIQKREKIWLESKRDIKRKLSF